MAGRQSTGKAMKLPDVQGQTAAAGTPLVWIHNNFQVSIAYKPLFLVILCFCLQLLSSQPHLPSSTHASVNGYIVLDANCDMQHRISMESSLHLLQVQMSIIQIMVVIAINPCPLTSVFVRDNTNTLQQLLLLNLTMLVNFQPQCSPCSLSLPEAHVVLAVPGNM